MMKLLMWFYSTGVKIPRRCTDPFIVGVYYGIGKPNLDDFFTELIDELLRLSPGNCRDGHCAVELRLVLGDCPMRAWLTGT